MSITMDHAVAATSTAKLAALLPILDAFNHRHRNQHSASPWWSSFRLFRRGARALTDDLRRHQALQQKLQNDAGGKKSTSTKTKAKTVQRQLLARVTILRDHTVQKAYVCFSQLIADNQHAPLGLLLLSTLAAVNSVLDIVAPRPSPELTPLPTTNAKLPNEQPSLATARPQKDRHDSVDVRMGDRGVAVSRDRGVAISRDDAPIAARKPAPKPNRSEDAVVPKRDRDAQPAKTKTKRSESSIDNSDEKQKKKKTKKKGKGDELSSLFGSL